MSSQIGPWLTVDLQNWMVTRIFTDISVCRMPLYILVASILDCATPRGWDGSCFHDEAAMVVGALNLQPLAGGIVIEHIEPATLGI